MCDTAVLDDDNGMSGDAGGGTSGRSAASGLSAASTPTSRERAVSGDTASCVSARYYVVGYDEDMGNGEMS